MGILVKAVVKNGGEAIGGISKGLFEKEIALTDLTDSHVVPSIHLRNALLCG